MISAGLVMALVAAGVFVAVAVGNIVHAIFGLAVALIGVAGIFAILGTPFVAVMEVLIYVGGISVAMVFAVMLSSLGRTEGKEGVGRRLLALVVAGGFFAAVATVLTSTKFVPHRDVELPAEAWNVEIIGDALLNRYNLVFEALSVVLLLAIIAAIAIARRPEEPTEEESS